MCFIFLKQLTAPMAGVYDFTLLKNKIIYKVTIRSNSVTVILF